jgi:M6 family metalloprotease-like protein
MLKKLLLITMSILATATSLYAVQAAPDPIDIQQPDGSKIKARILGDEFQNWTESEETGHTILQNKASGYWEYVEQAKDGTLRPNGIRILPKGLSAPLGLPKALRPPRDKENERRMREMLNDVYRQRHIRTSTADAATPSGVFTFGDVESGNASGDWVSTPVSGAKKVLVLLINFANQPLVTNATGWNSKIFDTAPGALSVANYYADNSFDSITITPVPHSQIGNPQGIITVTLSDNHPDCSNICSYAIESLIINHSLAAASAYLNFAQFDLNGNGTIEQSELTVYFIFAGYDASSNPNNHPNVWAHAWGGSGVSVNGKNIKSWALNGELNSSGVQHPMGVIAHELGHSLCGLPDLYDVSDQNQAMGAFSLMASGSWGKDSADLYSGTTPTSLDAWSREFLGWMAPVVPASSGAISLGHSLAEKNSAYKLIVPTLSTTEYFLIENRQPVNWDKGLKRWLGSGWQGGLLILHIDNAAGSFPSNDINSYSDNSTTPGHQGVVPVQASTVSCNMLSVDSSCAGKSTTLYYSANNTSLTPSSSPSSNYYSGAATNFSLTGISAQSSTMSAFLLLPPSAPVATTSGASGVWGTFATLNGTVNDNNASTTVTFQYGLTTGYGSTVSGGTITAGSGSSDVSAAISGLNCNSTYHFRVSGTNSISTSNGADKTFSTTACPPGAPAISSVAAGNSLVNVYFMQPGYDGGSSIISYTVTPSSGQSVTSDTIPITVSGLTNGSSYTFTVRATNAAGTGPASVAWGGVTPGVVIIDDSYATGYQLLQNAYDADASSKKIKILAGIVVGELTVNPSNDKGSITIIGGYNNAFSVDGGLPSILGKVTLSAGTTRFQNVVIRP